MENTDGDVDSKRPQTGTVHPAYGNADADADLVLRSEDGMLFHVHSIIMRRASSVFRQMLGIQRLAQEGADTPISLTESGDVILGMLDSVYPDRERPEVPSANYLLELAIAGEKYDIPVVTRSVRAFLNRILAGAHRYPEFPPLELYRISCKLGWEEEAKAASKATLPYRLFVATHSDALRKLDSGSLLRLLALHDQRKRIFMQKLSIHMFFDISPPPFNGNVMKLWGGVILEHLKCRWGVTTGPDAVPVLLPSQSFRTQWLALMYEVSAILSKSPLGEELKDADFWNTARSKELWNSKCPCCDRPVLLREKAAFVAAFLRDLDSLPDTI